MRISSLSYGRIILMTSSPFPPAHCSSRRFPSISPYHLTTSIIPLISNKPSPSYLLIRAHFSLTIHPLPHPLHLTLRTHTERNSPNSIIIFSLLNHQTSISRKMTMSMHIQSNKISSFKFSNSHHTSTKSYHVISIGKNDSLI